MTSKKLIKNLIASKKMVLKSKEPLYVDVSNVDIEDFKKLEKDLDRLKKLEKVIKIIKKKNFYLYALHYTNNVDVYNTMVDHEEDKLTNEEYKLMKEVLQNVKD